MALIRAHCSIIAAVCLIPGATCRASSDTSMRAGAAAIVHYWLDETEDIFEQRTP